MAEAGLEPFSVIPSRVGSSGKEWEVEHTCGYDAGHEPERGPALCSWSRWWLLKRGESVPSVLESHRVPSAWAHLPAFAHTVAPSGPITPLPSAKNTNNGWLASPGTLTSR